MLSADRIGPPQLGHRERGRTSDSPAGTREIATVMKLPKANPSTRAITMGNQLTAVNLRLDGVDGYATSRMYDTSSVNPVTRAPGITIGL
jgi:hypothetical protein